MSIVLLAIIVLLQGIPIAPQQAGTISGVLRDAAGKPAPGVRVAAVAVAQSPAEQGDGTAMASISQTDAEGNYRLDNVPPGRYYIAAGRLDLPTYYPGTQELNVGVVINVAAGTNTPSIDFALKDTSAGRAVGSFGGMVVVMQMFSTLTVPIDVRVDGGEKIPLFGSAGFTQMRFEAGGGSTTTALPLDSPALRITGPPPLEYRVTIENLPEGYTIKSMTYGGADLLAGTLQLMAASFTSSPTTVAGRVILFNGAQLLPPRMPSVGVASPPGGTQGATALAIILTRAKSSTATGVRVRGNVGVPEARSIYLSGKPGILFSDGSFEFEDVPAGRHVIVTSTRNFLAASVVVGNSDVDGIQLESTPVLPVGIETPHPPSSAGKHPPGTTVPFVSLRGKIVDRETRKAVSAGYVLLTGGVGGRSYYLEADGEFRFPQLLPGSYNIEVQMFDHETVQRTIVLGDDGLDLQIDAVPVVK
jgi:hypothetical protein